MAVPPPGPGSSGKQMLPSGSLFSTRRAQIYEKESSLLKQSGLDSKYVKRYHAE